MNILPVEVNSDDRGLLVGIRPEDVLLGNIGDPVQVQGAEYLGADSVITCAYRGQTITARVPGKTSLAAGATIRVHWRPEHLHFFDAPTGLRRDDVSSPVLERSSFAKKIPA